MTRLTRTTSFRLEGLEDRGLLSTLGYHPPAEVSTLKAAKTKTVTATFKADGSAVPTGLISNPDGSMTITASFSGTAKPTGKSTPLSAAFGKFTGSLSGTTGTLSTTTTIQTKKGTLQVTLRGHGTLVTTGADSGTFEITGGSGAFKNATGSGSYTASVQGAGTPSPSLAFSLKGNVKVRK